MKKCKRGLKRLAAFTLAVILAGTTVDLSTFAVSAAEGTQIGICVHHTEHTEDCGYSEGTAGSSCTHEHGEECYTKTENCVHISHDESCGYIEAQEGSICVHECSEESGCVTKELNCTHEHDEACGYVEAVEGTPCNYVCELCAEENSAEQQENKTAECTCGTDDDAIHATNCAVYVAPENPVCTCVEKCTEVNVWCDVCGFDYTACTGTDEAIAYEDTTTCTHSFSESGVCTVCGITGGYCGASTNTGGETSVTWTLKDGTLTISGSGAMADYDYTVDSYAPWYSEKVSIQTVIITGEINKIGNCAFYECVNLTSINIPDSMKSIGDFAFYENAFTSIVIPDNVTSIGTGAFVSNKSLTSITISDGDSVISIGDMAFYSCPKLTTVTISRKVTNIGEFLFGSCVKLTSITMPEGVTSIGRAAFNNAVSLESIIIPDSVTSIHETAFSGCTGLTSITASCKWKANIESGNFYGLDTSQLATVTYTHRTEVRGAVLATPTTDGYTGDTYCLDCGQMISKGSVIPATGSDSDEDDEDSDDSVSALVQTTSAPATQTYIVQKGDTLSKIAGMFDCTVKDIVALNSELIKNPNLIYPGWVLTIPVGGTTENTAPRADGTDIYVVQSGDTLYAIAKKYGCKVKDIVKLNGELIDDPDLIYPGWQLVIPQK